MKKDGDVVSYTVAELEAMRARGEDRTDWVRLDSMTEEELERAIASNPDWANIPHDWYEHATPHYAGAHEEAGQPAHRPPTSSPGSSARGRAIASGSMARCAPSSKRRSVAVRSDSRRRAPRGERRSRG